MALGPIIQTPNAYSSRLCLCLYSIIAWKSSIYTLCPIVVYCLISNNRSTESKQQYFK